MAQELSDPTDWASTSIPTLSDVDASLRCQICKDLFTNPVITTCLHTFCSLCIRRCLAADGRCPACRASEQEVKLRRNVAVQEIVDAFKNARVEALDVARREQVRKEEETQEVRGVKRKRGDAASSQDTNSLVRRTRSQARKEVPNASQEEDVVIVDVDDSKDEDYQPEDGLVACPMCSERMKEELVFLHLDHCDGTKQTSAKPTLPPEKKAQAPPRTSQPPPERLPQINYSLYKEPAMRKKLSELNIPSWGPKPLMEKRHREWINLWNSNCDSPYPRPRRELLSELEKWERTQGGQASNGQQQSAIMKKDFDGVGWARINKSDFDDLIARARENRKAKLIKPDDDDDGAEIDGAGDAPPAESDGVHATLMPPDPSLDSQSGDSYCTEESRNLQQLAVLGSSQDRPMTSSELPIPHTPDQHTGALETLHNSRSAEGQSAAERIWAPSNGAKQVPMFEVPQEPVVDADIGNT